MGTPKCFLRNLKTVWSRALGKIRQPCPSRTPPSVCVHVTAILRRTEALVCVVPPHVKDSSDLSLTWGSWCLATRPASIPGPCGLSGSLTTASWSGFWAVCWPEADGWAEQCRTLWDVQVCSQHVYRSGSRDEDPRWPTSEDTETNAFRGRKMQEPFPAVRAREMKVTAQIWAPWAKICGHVSRSECRTNWQCEVW